MCPFHASKGHFLTGKKLYFNSHSWETRVLRHTTLPNATVLGEDLGGTLGANDMADVARRHPLVQEGSACWPLPTSSQQAVIRCWGSMAVSGPRGTEDPARSGQHHPDLSSATQARGRGATPPVVSEASILILFRTKRSVILSTLQRTRWEGHHKPGLWQRHKAPSGVSLGPTCQNQGYPAGSGYLLWWTLAHIGVLPSPLAVIHRRCRCRNESRLHLSDGPTARS